VPNELHLKNVVISKDGNDLLNVNASIGAGEVLTLMGPSGSGKSSLLAYIGGFLSADLSAKGVVDLNGQDVTQILPHERKIGILFQDSLLFPHMSVGQNLKFAIPRAYKGGERHAMMQRGLSSVDLDGFEDRDPATLSGGQKARVALVRTLLAQPHALLLDEPFSKLDTDLRQQVRALVFQHAKDNRLPTILVTHDPDDAAAAGGRIIHLKDGLG
jgi:putative thiamine transport system ATP-binding protein